MIKKMEKKVFLHAAVNGQNVCWSSGSSAPTPPPAHFSCNQDFAEIYI